jgi:hypothetical protein
VDHEHYVNTVVAGEQTLSEAIASRGWTHRKENDDQRRTIYNGAGRRLGSFTAREAWDYLHQHAN